MTEWYPSDNVEILLDKIQCSLSYLFISELLDRPKRGDYKISVKGLELLSSCTDEQMNEYIYSLNGTLIIVINGHQLTELYMIMDWGYKQKRYSK